MNRPQDSGARVPSDWQVPRARSYAREQSADDAVARPTRRRGAETDERRPRYDRPASPTAVPTAGYYAAATPQRPAPRTGRVANPAVDDRPPGNPDLWADPYPERRRAGAPAPDRGWSGGAEDDDWDTQVFSLLADRRPANADDRGDRSPRSARDAVPGEAGEPAPRASTRTEAGLARHTAAVASLAAAVVHAFATPAHWGEWPLAGAFFAAAAGFQLIWGLLAFPFGHAFLRAAGLVANVGLLGLWAVSRVWGVPFGPHAGVPESFGAADLIVAAMEVAIVVGLLWSLLPRERHGIVSAGGYRAAVVLAFIAFGAMAVPGSAAALEHSHAHDAETTDHDDGHDHEHGTDMESPADAGTSAEPEAEASEPAEDHTHAPGEEHD
ncbi:hypothetical protein [Glycomyces sp. YM15]|uniref:hypothetical protein n=1 Tax=Glycomyces sp. YM15 TaxID=2800446 RepID=UPI001963800E|nr:hypothetical protein [Glycomyces sp. YM15]